MAHTNIAIVFELVSAFGGIGLSLGLPSDNFAFSGAFGPLSKLVVIVIMIRGRHRGLPVAVDRASKPHALYLENCDKLTFSQFSYRKTCYHQSRLTLEHRDNKQIPFKARSQRQYEM